MVETDNAALLKDAMTFGVWFDFETIPVMDMLEAGALMTNVTDEVNAILA